MAWTTQLPFRTGLLAATGAVVLVACGGRTGLLVDSYQMEDDEPADAGPAPDLGPQVAVGMEYSCWQRDGLVKCWGVNQLSQLGNGTTFFPQTTPLSVPGLSGVVELATAHSHACARKSDWTLSCWGSNVRGQVGDGTGCAPAWDCPDQIRMLPVAVLSDVAALAPGSFAQYHRCAQRLDKTIWCWGSNGAGQLCDFGTEPYWFAPRPIPDLNGATKIYLGGSHTCGMWGNDLIKCCGGNDVGQLGDGSMMNRQSPTPVKGLSDVAELSTGHGHTCALLLETTVVCWGGNQSGQLGDGTTVDRSSPVLVPGLSSVAAVAAGVWHTCVRMMDGTARCWGSNQYGQLGDGTTTDRLQPTPVVGLAGVKEIAPAAFHTCARVDDGKVLCWGRNNFGQLGDGTTTDRLIPTPVTW